MSDGKVIIDVDLNSDKVVKEAEQAGKKIGDSLDKNVSKAVSNVEKNVSKIGTSINKVNVGNLAKQFEKVDSSINKTNATIEKQKQKLEELKKAYENANDSKSQDKISQQMKNAELSISKAEKQLDKLNNKKLNLTSLKDSANGLDGNFTSASMKITKDLDNIEKKALETGKAIKSIDLGEGIIKVGNNISNVGDKLTMGVTLPLVGIGIAAMKTGADFDSQMSRVKAISGATGEEFEKLKQQAIDLGASTAFSAKQSAEAQEGLASAGFNTNEIMAAMPGMLDLAASSGEDLATSSDIAASTLRGFGLAADQAGHVADVLAKNAGATNAAVGDTGEALKFVAPAAHAAGLGLEETTAAIGILANSGIKGTMAGTTLRSVLTRLASPAKEAADDMKELGFNAFDSQGKMKPLSNIINDLSESLKGKTDQQKQDYIATIFGQEALSGMMVLMQGGSASLDDLTNSYKNADGAASDMAKTMQDNSKSAVEQMVGSLETTAIKVEEDFAPAIIQICNEIQNLANEFSNLSPEQQEFYVKMLMGAAAAGPLLKIIGSLTTGIGGLINVGSKIGTFFGLGTVAAEATATGTGFSGLLATLGAMTPAILPVAAALGALGVAIAATNTASDQMKDKLTTTTDGMSDWQKAINGMTGYTFKSKKELQDLGIEYKEFGDNIGDDFKKKVEDATASINEFQLFLGKIDLDNVIDSSESSSFNNQINKMVNDAINSINSKKSETQKSLSEMFKLDDNTIDETEQKVLDSISKGFDTQIGEENKLKAEIIAIKEKAVSEKRALNDQEVKDVQDKVNKIKEIELEAVGGTQEEHDYAKNEFGARVESVSPEDAASLLTEKRKAIDEESVQIKASYDTQLDTLRRHLKDEQDAIANATSEEAKQKATADAQNTQAEIDKFSQLKDKKLKMTRDEWQEYLSILKQKNPEALAMINEFTGGILSKEDKLSQNRLTTMKSTYTGLSNIVKSGTYELENTQTGSMENVTVSVDEATGKITGAYSETTMQVGGYTDQMAKDNAKLGQAHAELVAKCQQSMNALSGAHVNAAGEIRDSSGQIVGALEQVETATDGTVKGIYKINGVPIEIKTNADGTISNLADVISQILKIPKGTQTDIKINGSQVNTVDEAKTKLDELSKENPEATIKINGEDVGKAEDAKKKLDEITASNPNATITVESSDADSKLDTTKGKADEVGAEQPNVNATANTSEADSNLDTTSEKADEVDNKNPLINVTANTESANTGLEGILSKMEYIAEHPVTAFVNYVSSGSPSTQEKYTGTTTLKTGLSHVHEHGWETANNEKVKMLGNNIAYLIGNHYSGGDGINDHMTSVNEMQKDINNAVNSRFGAVISSLLNSLTNQTNILGQVANNTGDIKKNGDTANTLINTLKANSNGSFSSLATELTNANSAKEKADNMKTEENYWVSYYTQWKKSVEDQIKNTEDKDRKDALEKQKDYLDDQLSASKDAAEKEIQVAKDTAEQQVKIAEEKKDKLTKLAEATTTAIKAQLEAEKTAAEKVVNDELTALETDYNNSVAKIEADIKSQTDDIDAQIKALEDDTTQNTRDTERTDANNNINVLKTKMANTASEADKRSLQLQIKDAQKALNEKEDAWDIEDQKAALEEEKNLLSQSEENQKKSLETKYNTDKAAKEQELKDTDAYYDKLLQEDSINAQARYLMLQGNNNELVTLLQSYNPNWQDAGQSLADSLLDGLNSKKQSIQDAVSEMVGLRGTASNNNSNGGSNGDSSNYHVAYYDDNYNLIKGYASGTTNNPYAGLYNVDEQGFELSDSNNSVAYVSQGAGILNHMQSKQFIQDEISKQVALMRASVLSEQESMKSLLIGSMTRNSNSSIINNKSGDINFNVEHYHNNTDKDIEQTANELGFYANRQRTC